MSKGEKIVWYSKDQGTKGHDSNRNYQQRTFFIRRFELPDYIKRSEQKKPERKHI